MGIKHEHSEMVVIVPTRMRPHSAKALQESFKATNANADLIFVLDDDDPTLQEYKDLPIDILTYPREGTGMAVPLNHAARELLGCCPDDGYKYFAFMGDDHRPRTERWDTILTNNLANLGTGIVYGNDLLQGANLPTAVFMTRDIVEALNGMVPPNMRHLYLDDFWLHLGHSIKAIRYLDQVIIEHLHPVAGKAVMDAGYIEVSSTEISAHDHDAFNNYIRSEAYATLIEALS